MSKNIFTLNFYMKSGNVIRQGGITDYKITNEDSVQSIHLVFDVDHPDSYPHLLVKTIMLSQIEAVTMEVQRG